MTRPLVVQTLLLKKSSLFLLERGPDVPHPTPSVHPQASPQDLRSDSDIFNPKSTG